MHITVLNTQQVLARARKACDDIKQITDSGSVYTQTGYHRDPVQTLVMRRGSNSDGLISPLFESAAIEAEKRAAGAGELLLKIIGQSLNNDLKRSQIGIDNDEEWKDIKDHIRRRSIPARKSDLKSILGSETSYSSIVESIMSQACAGDKIIIKKTSSSKTTISRKTGYIFSDLNIDSRFYSKGFWSKKNCRLVLIDGVIENISEIHRLLEDLSSNRQPAVIVCIDALPDVCETIAKNYMSNRLDVILVKVPVDERHVNMLADMGVVMNSHPATALQGETIASGCARQNKVASRVTLARGQIILEDQEHNILVSKHIRELKNRIDANRDLSVIFEPRLESLCGASIQVDVGIDDIKKDPNIVEKLDRFFRMMPKILTAGIINKRDMSMFSPDKVCLLFGETDVASAETFSKSIEIFLSIRQTIKNAGAAITSI